MSGSPHFWTRLRKSRNKASSSPPDRLPFENEDVAAPDGSVMSSSLSSTVNSGGFYSTPPSHNGDVNSNASSASMSPNTPKKEWEANYKSYLSYAQDDGPDLSSDASTEHFNGLAVPDIHHNKNRNRQGSSQFAQSMPPHDSFLKPARHSSQQALVSSAGGVHGLDSDESGKSYGSEGSRSIRFSKGTKVDDHVHGGNFFSQVFKPKKDRERKARKSAKGKSEIKKRTQSCGSLDAAVRNGAEVAIKVEEEEEEKKKPKSRTGTSQSGIFKPGVVIAPITKTNMKQKDRSKRNSDRQRQHRLAFTEYHNSNRYAIDTTASYLGEEKSVQRGSAFAKLKGIQRATSAGSGGTSGGKESLPSVSEEAKVSLTLLESVEGPDSWIENRRYLMAPAIMAICPSHVYSLFQKRDVNEVGGTSQAFGKPVLGVAEAAQIVAKSLEKEEYEWSRGFFVLHQNYLLEYDVDDVNSRPRGFAFLQNASVRRIDEDKLRFDYYMQNSSRRSILVKLSSEAERDHWVSCLADAARLKVEDLYEFDLSGLGEVLGRGRYATVYPGRRRREKRGPETIFATSKGSGGILKKKPSFTSFSNLTVPLARDDYECALKVIDKHKFWERVRKDQERADSIVREASVQAALLASGDIYPGFLRVKSFFETLDKVILELELLEGTDLYHYISSKESVSEVEAANIMFDIISCLDAMKVSGIAHRDIKPANILMVDKEDPIGITVKLGDFGMATFVGSDNLVRGRCGTPGYVAPEILEAKKNGGYENKVDIFSAGVLLYILLCGYEPFSHAESEKELISENIKAKVEYPKADWASVSLEGRDLVEKMLERDPSKRIEPEKALQHPWITRRAERSKIPTETKSSKESLEDFACSIS